MKKVNGMAGPMRLYDTASQTIKVFDPEISTSMYVCGITPYDATHLGHAFTYLTFDLVIRRLEDLGHEVKMVRNVTDVDDSILPKARELGIHYQDLATKEMKQFNKDMTDLNMRPAFTEPRATESIEAIVNLIKQLKETGHTYMVDGITFFDTSTFDSFGSISGYDEETMKTYAAERGGRPDDPKQRNPLDFVLWQPSAADEPSWDSPFGVGRPGWHIECSAMVMSDLGDTIDLHGGGEDLIFPHHECEEAQSKAVTGKPLARHWMHVGMVAYEGTKMSKSLGNLVFVRDLCSKYDPRALRLSLLGHHYRSGFEWFDEDINEGVERLDRLIKASQCSKGPDSSSLLSSVRNALDNDLDTRSARESIDLFAKKTLEGVEEDSNAASTLSEAAALLGVLI